MLTAQAPSTPILIKAFNEGFIELDERQECIKLKEKLHQYNHDKNIFEITLDLRRCFTSYITSFLFLDEALGLLQQAGNETKKTLTIKLSTDFGSSKDMFWYFRYCTIHGDEDDDESFFEKLTEFFKQCNISVSIHSYSFNALADSDAPNNTYVLGD